MKALLFPILLAASAAGGVFSADFVRGDGPAPAKSDSHGEKADDHGKQDDGHKNADKSHGDKSSKGHGDKKAASGATDFIKFKRQFVVPIMENDAVNSLILLNLGLEVPADRREEMFRMEPRFRDAFIRELLQLSDDGYFDDALTSPDTYEVLRETLDRAAHYISEDGVKNVLILDMTRQDR